MELDNVIAEGEVGGEDVGGGVREERASNRARNRKFNYFSQFPFFEQEYPNDTFR